MNAGSLFTPKKNIYTVKYGTRRDAGSFRGPTPEAHGSHTAVYIPSPHLLPEGGSRLPPGTLQAWGLHSTPAWEPTLPSGRRKPPRVDDGTVPPSRPLCWPRRPGNSAFRAPGAEPLPALSPSLLFPGAPVRTSGLGVGRSRLTPGEGGGGPRLRSGPRS